ncbi:MAG: AAA family ATPase [Clostridiales bacterium]|jgi:hypothetical protein|nr:AAA family ATPase [Clostridiales bacterium]
MSNVELASKIPYAIVDYKKVATNRLNIDKTSYIAEIERDFECASLFRPRRMGKSLFLSTMYYYYDYKFESQFDELFKGTYVHDHPTPKKSSYSVLLFDFSGIEAASYEVACNQMQTTVTSDIKLFLDQNNYNLFSEIDYATSPAMILRQLFMYVELKHPIYILIDEYDHFTNYMLKCNMDICQRTIDSGGFMRAFFEVIKDATRNSQVLDKIFITGVSPMTINSMTGGFNISSSVDSYGAKYNDILGLTHDDAKSISQNYIRGTGKIRR